jgi:hypothetical protein
MKKSANIIKNYTGWLNESLSEATTTPSGPAVEAVSFISASSSASNLGPNLAAQMGVKVNTLYTIQTKTLGLLAIIYQDNKFGGEGAKSRGITIDEGTPVAAGQDILEINGKKITEAGAIVFTKAELTGPITIKASGNGLLTLMRFGEALSAMGGTYKNYLGTSKDYAVRFAIGGNVAEKDSRGFSFWFAKPGEITADSSTIAMVLAMALLKASGNENRIAQTDPVFSGWHKSQIANKTPQDTIKSITSLTAKVLEKRMMLAQNPPADASAAWNIKNALEMVQVPQEWAKTKVKLNPTGKAALEPMVDAIAKAVTPIAPPPGFGAESQAVFKSYADMIYNGLIAKRSSVEYWFLAVQEAKDWQTAQSKPGQTGQGTAAQGEGQFGKPAAKPATPGQASAAQTPPQK